MESRPLPHPEATNSSKGQLVWLGTQLSLPQGSSFGQDKLTHKYLGEKHVFSSGLVQYQALLSAFSLPSCWVFSIYHSLAFSNFYPKAHPSPRVCLQSSQSLQSLSPEASLPAETTSPGFSEPSSLLPPAPSPHIPQM